MISVEEAHARILADPRPTPAEIVGLSKAWDRDVVDPVIVRLTQPPANVSAMGGCALRTTENAAANLLRLALGEHTMQTLVVTEFSDPEFARSGRMRWFEPWWR